MSQSSSECAFQSVQLLRRYQAGDELAAEAIFGRYVERLTRLARSRLAAKLAARVDPEDIVQSAYRSFFLAARQGRFELAHSGDLWRLLVEVTLHKLYRQAERHQARRRSVRREAATSDGSIWQRVAGAEPTPDEAAVAAEVLEAVLAKLPPRGRQVVELRLQGFEQAEIAAAAHCTDRTVRRWLDMARNLIASRSSTTLSPVVRTRASSRLDAAAKPAKCRRRRAAGPRPGEPLWSDFVLQQQIGAGATGKVYRALERKTQRLFAVKFLKKALVRERSVVKRFVREAHTVAALAHPGIVAVQGVGRTPGGGYFLLMELVSGRDLHKVRQARTVPADQAAAWVAAAARIVQFAHEQGVIHCDLKPGNLLLDDQGAIRVTDFGLSVRPAEDSQSGGLAGTPAFMAPEQVDPCWGSISPRTDVWGLGAVLYFLLFGCAPHQGTGVADTLAKVVAGNPVSFPAKRKGVPLKLLRICRRALAKPLADRYSTAAALADAISEL
jgi:RNA polymerase sigma factor (sigma-70 family)